MGWPVWAVIPATLLMGGLIGAAQGYWIAYWKIPSFIVTLAGMLVFRGLTLWLLQGQNIGPFPKAFQALSTGFVGDVFGPDKPNFTALILVALAAAAIVTSGLRARAQDAAFGAVIAPIMPAFYNKPKTVDDIINHTVGRLLDLFGIETKLVKRWEGGPAEE